MLRYMAFAWNEAQKAPSEAALQLGIRLQLSPRRWTGSLALPGLKVFHADQRVEPNELQALPRGNGVILGTLFEPCSTGGRVPRIKSAFSAAEADRILSTRGHSLSSDYWGRYVAFAQDTAQRKTYVVRDPTGGLPCFHAVYRGVHLYFSSVEDCASLGLLELAVDWDQVAAYVATDAARTTRSAIRGISSVPAGQCVQIQHGDATTSTAWNPWRIACTDVMDDPQLAAHELRRTAKACTQAWATRHHGILHALSGGLGSSIVLSCLRDGGRRSNITCFNYYSSSPGDDERYFARLAANHTGSPLLEWQRDDSMRLADLHHFERTAAPGRLLNLLQASRREARLAGELCAGAIFSGCGGDELFYRTHGVLAAVDCLRSHGMGRRFIEAAMDTALLEDCSLWRILWKTLGRKLDDAGPSAPASRHARELLTRQAQAHVQAQDAFEVDAALLPGVLATPPGKRRHAYSLSLSLDHYDPLAFTDHPERVQPLLSQPLIELCLRMPTYVLTHKGWDRAIARQAFVDDVPREILHRRTKQRMQENMSEILAANLETARELLLDGQLVSAGLLDRGRTEMALADTSALDQQTAREILDHVGTELWLQSWKTPRSAATAAPRLSLCL